LARNSIAIELFQFEMNYFVLNQSHGHESSSNIEIGNNLNQYNSSCFQNSYKSNLFDDYINDLQPNLNTGYLFFEIFLQKLEIELNLFLLVSIKTTYLNKCLQTPQNTKAKEEDKINHFIQFNSRSRNESFSQVSYLDNNADSEEKSILRRNLKANKSKNNILTALK